MISDNDCISMALVRHNCQQSLWSIANLCICGVFETFLVDKAIHVMMKWTVIEL
jgi:hypothetical protein